LPIRILPSDIIVPGVSKDQKGNPFILEKLKENESDKKRFEPGTTWFCEYPGYDDFFPG